MPRVDAVVVDPDLGSGDAHALAERVGLRDPLGRGVQLGDHPPGVLGLGGEVEAAGDAAQCRVAVLHDAE